MMFWNSAELQLFTFLERLVITYDVLKFGCTIETTVSVNVFGNNIWCFEIVTATKDKEGYPVW